MDTRWINSAESWWQDYRLWIRSIENVFIIVFAMLVPTLFMILFGGESFPSIIKINYQENQTVGNRVNYIDALRDPIKYKESRLIEKSVELSNIIYDQTNYLKDIESATTKEEKEKIILKLQQSSMYYAGVVIINNETGDYYSNRSWLYEPPHNLSPPKEVIEGLAKNENWVYKIVKPTANLEEIYFSDGKVYNSQIYSLRVSFSLTLITTFILIILLIKKIAMFKRLGKRSYLSNIKTGYIYNLIQGVTIIFKRNLIIKEVIKDRVLIFTVFSICVYLIFYGIISKIDFWVGYPQNYTTLTYIFIAIVIFLVMHFIFKFIRKYEAIEVVIEDLNDIKKGNMELEVQYNNDDQVRVLAKGINTLRISYKDSIEEGIKNEKLKTELISNVSHDLKTPLTSIINYVNILQRDDITEEEKNSYIQILERKSNRLKKLIEDLFEVSKMNSGKIELSKYTIDIVQLTYQCISEVEDCCAEKNMEFKVKAPDELMLYVDPERISRVFQNLTTNSFKYGLDGTRIYIEITDMNDSIEISFKNVSAFELDFNENEILERFARGDKSRNSLIEGSGLGLAIAKTIVELHGGSFRVECEGDLFKAFVTLPKISEE